MRSSGRARSCLNLVFGGLRQGLRLLARGVRRCRARGRGAVERRDRPGAGRAGAGRAPGCRGRHGRPLRDAVRHAQPASPRSGRSRGRTARSRSSTASPRVAGMPFRPDDWQLDICVTGPHKCISGPSGLSLVTVSDRAWERIRANPVAPRDSYLSLLDWKEKWLRGRAVPVHPLDHRDLRARRRLRGGARGGALRFVRATRPRRAGRAGRACAGSASRPGRGRTRSRRPA